MLHHWIIALAPPVKRRPRTAARPGQVTVAQLKRLARYITYARDGRQCRWCGSRGRMNWHHVFSQGGHAHLKADLDNCVILCVNCHLRRWHQGDAREGMAWWAKELGTEKWRSLELRAKSRRGRTDNFAVKAYLEAEAKRIGVTEDASKP